MPASTFRSRYEAFCADYETWLLTAKLADEYPRLSASARKVSGVRRLARLPLVVIFTWRTLIKKLRTFARPHVPPASTIKVAEDVVESLARNERTTEGSAELSAIVVVDRGPLPSSVQSAGERTGAAPEAAAGVLDALRRGQPQVAELFLAQMEERTKDRRANLKEKVAELQLQMRLVFFVLFLAGLVTTVLAVVAIVLIFEESLPEILATTVLDLVTGTGTAIMWKLRRSLQREYREHMRIEDENLRVLQAIQATLLINDDDRRDHSIDSLVRCLISDLRLAG